MLNIFAGAVTVVVSIPLIVGWIPPNRWYGVRLPESSTSEENWYSINRLGGWVMIVWGAAMIGYGVYAQVCLRPELHVIGLAIMLGSLPLMVIGLAIYVNRKYGQWGPPPNEQERLS